MTAVSNHSLRHGTVCIRSNCFYLTLHMYTRMRIYMYTHALRALYLIIERPHGRGNAQKDYNQADPGTVYPCDGPKLYQLQVRYIEIHHPCVILYSYSNLASQKYQCQ